MEMQDIRIVYNALADEQSKYIFSQRLFYSISGDPKYIRELVNHEIGHYAETDQMYRLINWVKDRCGDIIVFGGGFAGQQIVESLHDHDVDVRYISDNNQRLWGKKKYGIEVIPPKDILKINKALVIVGVNGGKSEVVAQLANLGVPVRNIFIPDKEWWIGPYDQYFDRDIIKPGKDEVLIDAGAFDGTDSLRFIEWSKNTNSVVYALEPDRNNMVRTKERLSAFPNINVLERGLWDCTTSLHFSSGEFENSSVSSCGDVEIKTVAVDELNIQLPVTYIKMDIEGSEGKALDGSKDTIVRYKPRLAICVYHKMEDILDLPLKVLKMVPDYKLYLRHYSYSDTETVLYAIPERNG